MSHYIASMEQSKKEDTSPVPPQTDKLQVLPEIYYIRGMCGVVLDVAFSQAKAVKEYILHYQGRVAEAHIVAVRNGKQYSFIPTGSAADYK